MKRTETSSTEKLIEIQTEEDRYIEKKFYAEYKDLREKIYLSLLKNNPEYDIRKSDLISLTQKFLDRIIFCRFCEDSREQLLPTDVIGNIIRNEVKDQYYDRHGHSIYTKVKELFRAIDTGGEVFRIEHGYNGGLFRQDTELDSLNITNEMFETIGELSKYDFGNDEILNVNVFGHIFEQSISDLEDLKSSFDCEIYDRKKSKRKKEGVFYTPEYITRYIVENTIGRWLSEKFAEAEALHKHKRKNKEELVYMTYQQSLQNITVLDPACGSGAFLVQAFDYLFAENKRVIDVLNNIADQITVFDTYEYAKTILTNNLYGVDLNPESVEITKLSLWLKTAQRNNPLTMLDDNIKCGNSLIDDTEVAGDIAFKWEDEFEGIMSGGGFDCVIGNPPYGGNIRTEDKKYFKQAYKTAKTIKGVQKGSLDTYTLFIEAGFGFCKTGGYLCYIVPISITSSDSLTGVHKLLEENCSVIKVSSYAVRPQPIFENATVNTSILFFIKDGKTNEKIFSTKMHRKSKNTNMHYLVNNLEFIDVSDVKLSGRYPKISYGIEKSILKKIHNQHSKIRDCFDPAGKKIYYRSAGGRYFKVITNYSTGSSSETSITLENKIANSVGAILSSNLYFWFYQVYSDNLSLKSYEINVFGLPIKKFSYSIIQNLESVYSEYLEDIEKNANIRQTGKYANISSFKEYKIGKSKHLIDKIDDLICPLYGMTKEETEFVKNYELEFRLAKRF